MAAHPAQGAARAFVNRPGHSMHLVEVQNTYGGNLTETDWVPIVQELYSVFHTIQSKEEVARLHLFHSMPVALGNFVPVTVYNWEAAEGSYYPVLRLNEVEGFL